MAKVVVVIGNIGSGKTTLTPIIAKDLRAKMVDADNLFQTTNPFRERYLKNNKRWALANELWMTLERVGILSSYGHLKKKKVVVDSGILMSWAYTYSHFLSGTMSQDEWGVYKRLFDKVVGETFEELAVVRLDCKIETLLKRIKKRGRQFELEYYTHAYLSRINKGIDELEKKLKKEKVLVSKVGESEVNGLLKKMAVRQNLMEKIRQELDLVD